MATRIATYGLEVSERARAYVNAHLHDPAFRRWRALGLATGPDLPWYARDYPQTAWPGPQTIPAQAIEVGASLNETCPYSGKAVQLLLELDGKVFGFCNATCRDKTVADPAIWPAFTEMAGLTPAEVA